MLILFDNVFELFDNIVFLFLGFLKNENEKGWILV